MRSDCHKAREKVYHYLDGEVSRYRRWRIERHLRRCPPCTGGFSFESKLQQRIREDCVDDVPEEFMARLTTFLDQNGPTDTSVDPTAGGSDV